MAGRGGWEGADTSMNRCWFALSPLITSASVFIVSVKTSAGIPEARRIWGSWAITPLVNVACWQEFVTWLGLVGELSVRTSCKMCNMFATF